MQERLITIKLRELENFFPVIGLRGPRQSGKTTVLKMAFPDYEYINLESPDTRRLAQEDPRALIESGRKKIFFDEVQNVPDLFSYIQSYGDTGDYKFIVSGSQNFVLNEKISQSLAGRIGLLTLFPFSLQEIHGIYHYSGILDLILKGFYPRIYDKNIPAEIYHDNYISTYVERDVMALRAVQDRRAFMQFLKMCAHRAGSVLNLKNMAEDIGKSENTLKDWLSILESSYIVHLLKPFEKNYNKRISKSPKLYFYDTGLLCNLIGLKNTDELEFYRGWGGIFENFVINEFVKNVYNKGNKENFYYWKNQEEKEIDLIIDSISGPIPIEIKAGITYSKDYFKNLEYFRKIADDAKRGTVIYRGTENLDLEYHNLRSWDNLVNPESIIKSV